MNYSEDALIEQPSITLLKNLGWQVQDCFNETFGDHGSLGRETSSEVVLRLRLLAALERLNPGISREMNQLALEEIARDRSTLSMAEANRQVYRLLRNGVLVTSRDADGNELSERLRIVDWDIPGNNDFFLASQIWISGDVYKCRPDLVGFVNGIPLILMELKAAHKNVKTAYDHNLRDYKTSIPQIFWYNAVIILSNGSESRIGSMTAPWEHFTEWKKINDEGEAGVISLETMLRGTCHPEKLLDLVENFTLFEEAQGGLRKIIAKNHQVLGVNAAFRSIQQIRRNQGRLGVFWHTQGSGKSYSMVFFSQKVLRKLPGNWTFLIVTDRLDLDDQIYKNFANCGVVTEPEVRVRAQSGEHLQRLLAEDHRFLFTLIQKFHIESGMTYPQLSGRSDIVVMTDEAHRSQYDVLALNMRNALPNATFLAFTGTPLMVGEEKTRRVFGDYVSIYNFKQSVDDQATVPLYYENRIPELQLINPNLNQDMAELLDATELDERQEERLEREFSREYHLITRNDRLEKIAEDIVHHFLGRGFQGKAMVISIDKATAIKMYDKVRVYWNREMVVLQAELENCSDEDRPLLKARLNWMQSTDMAVVVSHSQNEVEDLRAKRVEILPHRIRMNNEDLATKFKDPDDPLRLVFVCAMWMTGFDAPACSTIYLDKPMKNHTLMQTIARANRVFGEKVNGLIVDYIGVFRDLQRALAIYGTGPGGGVVEGEMPVLDKENLVNQLRQLIGQTRDFLLANGVDLSAIQAAVEFQRVGLLDDAVNTLVSRGEVKREFLNLALLVNRLFLAILPDLCANEFGADRKAIVIMAEKIRSLTPPPDISGVMTQVDRLLDESVAPPGMGYRIRATEGAQISEAGGHPSADWVDLSKIDFALLRRQFETSRKHIEAEKLQGLIHARLNKLVRLNRSRMDYYEHFQAMIDAYNIGAENVDAFFAQLVSFAQQLNEEEQRGIAEQLTEEELAIFDLLIRPNLTLSRTEREKVREVARNLLVTLKAEHLVLDWRKNQTTRARVHVAIHRVLEQLPDLYNPDQYEEACIAVYQHIYDSYWGDEKSVYTMLSV